MKKRVLFVLPLVLLFFNCSKKQVVNMSAGIHVIDYAGREVTLAKPAKKIIVMADNAFQIVKELGAVDKVVGLDSKTKGYWNLYLMRKTNPELADLPDLGKTKSPNYEQILSLNPDLILLKGNKDAADILQSKTGVPVAAIVSKSGYDFETYDYI